MNYFNHEKLVLARQFAGLSQKNLAEKIGVSQSSLSKIEKGSFEPSEETLKNLEQELGFPSSFFASKSEGASALSFHAYRRKASVPISKVNKILAEISIKTDHQEVFVNLREEKSIDFEQYRDLSIVELSMKLRNDWGIGSKPIENLTKHIEDMGIDIFLCDFSDAQVDGVTSKGRNGLKAIFINCNQPADRYRFSLAHELCHYLKHSNEPICTKEMEDEANYFAAELLMPAEVLKDQLKTTDLAVFAELKKKWRVSMAALIYRAKTLGSITANQSTSLWKKMAMHGFRKIEPFPIEPEEPMRIKNFLSKLDRESDSDLLEKLNLTDQSFGMLYKDFYDAGGNTLS